MKRNNKVELFKTDVKTEFHTTLPNPVIQWEPVYRSAHTSSPRSENDFIANFTFSKGTSGNLVKTLHLRIGKQVIKELGWDHGDYVLICFDKDDICSMMALKHERGYKLIAEMSTDKNPDHAKIFRVGVKADFLTLPQFKGMHLTYKIDREKRLLFRLNKVD